MNPLMGKAKLKVGRNRFQKKYYHNTFIIGRYSIYYKHILCKTISCNSLLKCLQSYFVKGQKSWLNLSAHVWFPLQPLLLLEHLLLLLSAHTLWYCNIFVQLLTVPNNFTGIHIWILLCSEFLNNVSLKKKSCFFFLY